MSAVPSTVFDETPQRLFPRTPINVPVDLIALRSGIPENLPGRCTDLSAAGEGAVVASSVCRRSVIGPDARVGPFAVLAEGTEVPAAGAVGPAASDPGAPSR